MKKEAVLLAVALVVLLTSQSSANYAPLIGEIGNEIIVCESSPLSYPFQIIDVDSETLDVGIYPSDIFFVKKTNENTPSFESEIFSANLTKEQSGKKYQRTIFASDGMSVDTREINISVFESNNPPRIVPIGARTLIAGLSELSEQVEVRDIETQNPDGFTFTISGDLNMNVDPTGLLTYSPTISDLGLHEMQLCVTDSGLGGIEDSIGICAEDTIAKTTCEKFQVLVVETNVPPTILIENSTNISRPKAGTEKILFEIYKFDPEGITPDTYWYVDGRLMEIDVGQPVDNFVYSFGCGVFGSHTVKALITDGLTSDFAQWPIDILKVGCPDGISLTGRVEQLYCSESWGCSEWDLCQDAKRSAQGGIISKEDYNTISTQCTSKGWGETVCGFRIRECIDTSDCNTLEEKPNEIEACYFSLEPSCSDGIKNCHDGLCELLTDCGGPCNACETCSDNRRNQGEGGIDCEGPCHQECREVVMSEGEVTQKQIFSAVTLAFLVFAIVQAVRLGKAKRQLTKIQTEIPQNE